MNVRTFTRNGSRMASVDHLLDATTLKLATSAAWRRWPADLLGLPILLADSSYLDDAHRLAPGQAFEVAGLPDGWALCWPAGR